MVRVGRGCFDKGDCKIHIDVLASLQKLGSEAFERSESRSWTDYLLFGFLEDTAREYTVSNRC